MRRWSAWPAGWASRGASASPASSPMRSSPAPTARPSALWFPSTARSEAFGLVQVEAMASGLPVLNTAIPGSGVDEVSLDGVSGLTVPMGDAHALAAAAARLLAEPGLRLAPLGGARERAQREFAARPDGRAHPGPVRGARAADPVLGAGAGRGSRLRSAMAGVPDDRPGTDPAGLRRRD